MVPQGSTTVTFPITTGDPTVPTGATVTANYNGSMQTATTTIKPNVLTSVKVSPTSVKGGSAAVVTGTVTLTQTVAVDTTISLSSDTPSAAEVLGSVTVSAGQKSATFSVTHHAVSAKKTVTIMATRAGVSKTATLTVNK